MRSIVPKPGKRRAASERSYEIAFLLLLALLAAGLALAVERGLPADASAMHQQSPISPLEQPAPTASPEATTAPAPTPVPAAAPPDATSPQPPMPVWALAAIMLVLGAAALVIGSRKR